MFPKEIWSTDVQGLKVVETRRAITWVSAAIYRWQFLIRCFSWAPTHLAPSLIFGILQSVWLIKKLRYDHANGKHTAEA
jgi:hypothetical protein